MNTGHHCKGWPVWPCLVLSPV